jgi:DNA replication protein DnaC
MVAVEVCQATARRASFRHCAGSSLFTPCGTDQQARLPGQWTLGSFPFKKQPGVSRRLIQELAELEFIPRAENIVFIGPTGVGKTGLASGLLLKALQNGYRGL